jgi:hypothetical protein
MSCMPTGRPWHQSPTGKASPGTPARLAGRVKDIFQVHRQRVIAVLADRKAVVGRNRRGDDIHLFESPLEIRQDERAHLLRLPVIGIVIPGRQGIGAQHDAPLDLRPEPAPRVCAEDLPQASLGWRTP